MDILIAIGLTVACCFAALGTWGYAIQVLAIVIMGLVCLNAAIFVVFFDNRQPKR